MGTEGTPIDIKKTLDLVEKARLVDDSEIEVAADDGGLSALVQKAAKAEAEADEESGR